MSAIDTTIKAVGLALDLAPAALNLVQLVESMIRARKEGREITAEEVDVAIDRADRALDRSLPPKEPL